MNYTTWTCDEFKALTPFPSWWNILEQLQGYCFHFTLINCEIIFILHTICILLQFTFFFLWVYDCIDFTLIDVKVIWFSLILFFYYNMDLNNSLYYDFWMSCIAEMKYAICFLTGGNIHSHEKSQLLPHHLQDSQIYYLQNTPKSELTSLEDGY